MTRRLFSLYGLQVDSPVPLPGEPVEGGAPSDVTVHFGGRPPAARGWSEEEDTRVVHRSETTLLGIPVLTADRPGDEGWLRLRYAEGIRFHISAAGDEVWTDWRAPLTEADAVAFLVGPILGVVLRRMGVLTLHASAVVLHGRAWAFLGSRGSGKSTLAAAFARAGTPVLTEDALALRPGEDGWTATPAYREIRLWEEGARLVAPAGEELPALTPTWPKGRLDLAARGLPFASAPVPLGGCFILEDYAAAGVPSRTSRLEPGPAMIELVANVYVNYLATAGELARELVVLADISRRVPVWTLRPASGEQGLAETVATLATVTE